jgi:hypothetical protein
MRNITAKGGCARYGSSRSSADLSRFSGIKKERSTIALILMDDEMNTIDDVSDPGYCRILDLDHNLIV